VYCHDGLLLHAAILRRTMCPLLMQSVSGCSPLCHACRLDRCFLELMQDGEEAFLNFRRVVESANVIMATYADEKLGDTAGVFHALMPYLHRDA
jgi:hypothetical protein